MATGDVRGYIQYHIGSSLDAMQDALAAEALGRFSNLVRFFVTKTTPVLDPETAKKIKTSFPHLSDYDRLPGNQRAGALVEDLNNVVERILFELREKGYYAWGRDEEAGDASGAALRDEPEQVTV